MGTRNKDDDEYHQAVLMQAEYLGMDPAEDEDLLWSVLESLCHC
jgi:hypothetical protein